MAYLVIVSDEYGAKILYDGITFMAEVGEDRLVYADVGESDDHHVISSQKGTILGNMERKKLLISEK